ncbi:MAG: hypothetical protein SOV25_00155, partial [Candidatus Onthovivens sp.]|nr:hypothetical protein [Candidatus Onthovivens sp.]
YGLHEGDYLQLQDTRESIGKFIRKVNETDIEVEYEDKTTEIINKNRIVNIIQYEKNGRITYIRYRD